MKVNITFKKGLEVIAVVEGFRELSTRNVSFEKVVATEQLLEQLTGFRAHIDIVNE